MLITEPEDGQDSSPLFSQYPKGPGPDKKKPDIGILYMPQYLKEYYKDNGERKPVELNYYTNQQGEKHFPSERMIKNNSY